jgi:uncharacterized membrane protein YczE
MTIKLYFKKYLLLLFGLFLFSIGVSLTIKAGLGVSPWDVLHIGLSKYTSLSIGRIVQILGLIILTISCFFKIMPGVGTITNMVIYGIFLDYVRNLPFLPQPQTLLGRIVVLLIGTFIIGWATYFYISAGLGSGPRDNLMLVLLRKTNLKVWKIRTAMELTVLTLGYIMGGPVGIGTPLVAISIGPTLELACRITGANVKDIPQRTLDIDYKAIHSFLLKGKAQRTPSH